MISRTIRKAFADCGVYPFNLAPVIECLDAARSPTPELYWPTGDTPPPQSSSLPSSPPRSAAQARRTQGEMSRIADRQGINPDTRRHINLLSCQVIQMAEEISLPTSTIQHQLPPMPSKARKSRKEIGRFGAVTTNDAKRHAMTKKEKNMRQAYGRVGRWHLQACFEPLNRLRKRLRLQRHQADHHWIPYTTSIPIIYSGGWRNEAE